MPLPKPTICLDFDGVIHDYKRGWRDGSIYGSLVDGFIEWALDASRLFQLAIYSSRSSTPHDIKLMQTWLAAQLKLDGWDTGSASEFLAMFQWPSHKPPAFLSIDDRAITFKGDWSNIKLRPASLLAFKPWNHPTTLT